MNSKLLLIVGSLTAGLITLASAGFVISDVEHRGLVKDLVSDHAEPQVISLDPSRYEGLPEPVQRYFRYAFDGQDQVRIESIHWEEEGHFKLPVGEFSTTATQHSLPLRPHYVWRGLYRTDAGLTVLESRDAFSPEAHSMRAKLMGYVTVMDTNYADSDKLARLHSYLALRYYGTALAFPWALLPNALVDWEAKSSSQAWLVLNHGDLQGRYLVTFDRLGRITRMETPGLMLHGNDNRLREVGEKSAYREVNGFMVPTAFDYRWYDENDELDSRYRLTMNDIRYR